MSEDPVTGLKDLLAPLSWHFNPEGRNLAIMRTSNFTLYTGVP